MRENKLLMLIASAIIVATAMFASSSAMAQNSGTCGDNATWTYDENTKTLTISGTGAMSDYYSSNQPWFSIKDIQTVVIGEGITHIGEYSFFNYSGLISVTIPNTTKSIGRSAFSACYSLGKLSIPNGVETIGKNAFSSVKYISYTGNASGAPWNALTLNGVIDDDGLVYEDDAKTKLTAYFGKNSDINIPDGVISIGKRAFFKTDITSVNIPGSVESIGESAFDGTGLSSVTIPGSVKTIESAAFASCENLESVILTEGIETLGSTAFYECDLLQSIIIPASVTNIGSQCFNKDKVEAIDIIICYANPELITFGDFTPLHVRILCVPSNYYNKWVELNLYGVRSITSEFSIINGVAYCANDAGKVYASELLSNAPADITIESKITINNAEYDVIGVAEKLFRYNKTYFNSVTISEGITSIGDWAFSECIISSLTIPESVTTIGEQALCDAKIPDIYCYANPNISGANNLISNIYSPLQFHVPVQYLEQWKKINDNSRYSDVVTIVGDIKSISSDEITIPTQTYTGSALTPVVKDGDKTLVEGEDYTITLPQGGCTNAGEYTVTLQGKKFYYKKAEKTFTINPVPVTVTAEAKSKTFGESDPEFTATVTGLVNNESPDLITYTLTRTEGENAGEYTITPKGDEKQGNYVVSFVDATLTITKATPNPEPEPEPQNPSTPVSSVDNNGSNVKVWSYAHTIYIASIPDSQYKIIDLQGRTIATSITTSSLEQININKSGILVVIINGKSYKVSL